MGWYEIGEVVTKSSMTTRPVKPVRERPPAPPSTGCTHDYKVLNQDLYKATFYCSKCLNMRTKEL